MHLTKNKKDVMVRQQAIEIYQNVTVNLTVDNLLMAFRRLPDPFEK